MGRGEIYLALEDRVADEGEASLAPTRVAR